VLRSLFLSDRRAECAVSTALEHDVRGLLAFEQRG